MSEQERRSGMAELVSEVRSLHGKVDALTTRMEPIADAWESGGRALAFADRWSRRAAKVSKRVTAIGIAVAGFWYACTEGVSRATAWLKAHGG